MITDEKRREVAQKLRAIDMSDIEVDGYIIDSPKYVGLLLMRMLDAACDYRDGLHYFPGFFSAHAVVELFADLIDRPTARNIADFDRESFKCSRCGYRVLSIDGAPDAAKLVAPEGGVIDFGYCPNCDAEVVDDARL